MNRALRPLELTLFFSVVAGPQTSADIVLDSWSHTLRASDADGQESDRFSSVSHGLPFTGALQVQFREIRTDGTFTTSFDGSQLTSVQEAEHSAVQTTQDVGDVLWSHAVSAFWLTSAMDVEVSVTGSLSFDLFGEESAAGLGFEVSNNHQGLLHSKWVGGLFPVSPGTVDLTDTVVLPGGTSWYFNVISDLLIPGHRFAPPLSAASSEISLTATAIPEPASLLLVGFGTWLSWRCRQKKYSLRCRGE